METATNYSIAEVQGFKVAKFQGFEVAKPVNHRGAVIIEQWASHSNERETPTVFARQPSA
jgi:hypothetical protein